MDHKNQNAIVVRKAGEADIPHIVSLYVEFGNHQHGLHDFYARGDSIVPHLEKRISGILAKDEEVLLVVDSQYGLGGFLIARLAQASPHVNVEKFGYIEVVYLKEEYRGLGFGRMMVKEAANILRDRGATHLELTVDVNNHLGYNAWCRMGFEQYQRRMMKKIE